LLPHVNQQPVPPWLLDPRLDLRGRRLRNACLRLSRQLAECLHQPLLARLSIIRHDLLPLSSPVYPSPAARVPDPCNIPSELRDSPCPCVLPCSIGTPA